MDKKSDGTAWKDWVLINNLVTELWLLPVRVFTDEYLLYLTSFRKNV